MDMCSQRFTMISQLLKLLLRRVIVMSDNNLAHVSQYKQGNYLVSVGLI